MRLDISYYKIKKGSPYLSSGLAPDDPVENRLLKEDLYIDVDDLWMLPQMDTTRRRLIWLDDAGRSCTTEGRYVTLIERVI